MPLRPGHGAGRGTPHYEVAPPDELPPASPAQSDRKDHGADGRFLPGNRTARARKLRPGPLGHLDVAKTDPRFLAFARWGSRYASHRRAELAKAHGGSISAGVGALVESAAMSLSASRFVQSQGAETGDADLLKRASDLAAAARQHELAAWELAARECAARPKTNPLAALRASVEK